MSLQENKYTDGVDVKGDSPEDIVIQDIPKPEQGFRKGSPNFGMVNIGTGSTQAVFPVSFSNRSIEEKLPNIPVVSSENDSKVENESQAEVFNVVFENLLKYLEEADIQYKNLDKICKKEDFPKKLHRNFMNTPFTETMLFISEKLEYGPIIKWLKEHVNDVNPIIISTILNKKLRHDMHALFGAENGEKIFKSWENTNYRFYGIIENFTNDQLATFLAWSKEIFVNKHVDVFAELSRGVLPELVLDVATKYFPVMAVEKKKSPNESFTQAQIDAVARREQRRAQQNEMMRREAEKNRVFLENLQKQHKQAPSVNLVSAQNTKTIRPLDVLVKIGNASS